MRRSFFIALFMVLSLAVMPSAFAAMNVGNTVCPVSGQEIGAGSVLVEYGGRAYNVCPSCGETFLKNPGRYGRIAREQAWQHQKEERSLYWPIG